MDESSAAARTQPHESLLASSHVEPLRSTPAAPRQWIYEVGVSVFGERMRGRS